MPKYRKKPIVIDAEQWLPQFRCSHNVALIPSCKIVSDVGELCVEIQTLEGKMLARPGDWIIRGVNGEYYPCKPDIFDKTYEVVLE